MSLLVGLFVLAFCQEGWTSRKQSPPETGLAMEVIRKIGNIGAKEFCLLAQNCIKVEEKGTVSQRRTGPVSSQISYGAAKSVRTKACVLGHTNQDKCEPVAEVVFYALVRSNAKEYEVTRKRIAKYHPRSPETKAGELADLFSAPPESRGQHVVYYVKLHVGPDLNVLDNANERHVFLILQTPDGREAMVQAYAQRYTLGMFMTGTLGPLHGQPPSKEASRAVARWGSGKFHPRGTITGLVKTMIENGNINSAPSEALAETWIRLFGARLPVERMQSSALKADMWSAVYDPSSSGLKMMNSSLDTAQKCSHRSQRGCFGSFLSAVKSFAGGCLSCLCGSICTRKR